MCAGARPVGGARDRGVRARRAKAASCCIDCISHERLSGNVPRIYLTGQTAEHSVASEYHSQCLVLIPQLKCTDRLGFSSTSSAFGTNISLICLAVKEVRCTMLYFQSSPCSSQFDVQYYARLSSASANLGGICATLKVSAANPFNKACPASGSIPVGAV